MSLPHAVIIAGGKGERLGGVRKAELRIGNQRLIDRVSQALGPVAMPLLVSSGAWGERLALPEGAEAIADLPGPLGGPLAGLAAAVAALHARGITTGLLISAAVDTPLLPADYVLRLRQGLGDSRVVHATWQDQCYPPNALWRIEALADLPQRVAAHRAPHSLRALQLALEARAVAWTGPNPFANLNTLSDLLALTRQAKIGAAPTLIHSSGN